VRRSGTSNGTLTPLKASRALRTISADRVTGGAALKNASAHPIEHARHGREIDGDLVGEPGRGGVGPDQAGVVRRRREGSRNTSYARVSSRERHRARSSPEMSGWIAAGELPVGPLDFVGTQRPVRRRARRSSRASPDRTLQTECRPSGAKSITVRETLGVQIVYFNIFENVDTHDLTPGPDNPPLGTIRA
jgi:hypothetical protein